MSTTKLTRSEQARLNGAKSRGPKTLEGRLRIANARRTHGLYAVRSAEVDEDSRQLCAAYVAGIVAQSNPRNPAERACVEEIAESTWHIARLRLCAEQIATSKTERLRATGPISWQEASARAEVETSSPTGTQNRIQSRINSLIRRRSRLVRQLGIIQLAEMTAKTQQTLQTQELRVGSSTKRASCAPHDTQECCPKIPHIGVSRVARNSDRTQDVLETQELSSGSSLREPAISQRG